MKISSKNLILFLSDCLIFYLSLFLALFIRHIYYFNLKIFIEHFLPFSFILIIWLFIFYIFELYNFKKISFFTEYLRNYFISIFVAVIASIIIFYTFPFLKIAPKTLLLIFLLLFLPLNLEIRNYLIHLFAQTETHNIALIGTEENLKEIKKFLEEHKLLGIKEMKIFHNLKDVKNNFDFYVISDEFLKENKIENYLLQKIKENKIFLSATNFVESFMNKIPLDSIDETWIINNLFSKNEIYSFFKRAIDIIISLTILTLSLPFWPIIILGIKISSPGPIFFKDKRVGKNEKIFILYKFRTLHQVSYKKPKEGEIFGVKENDQRVFWWGKVLRKFHLDELPQLINVLKGDLSLVGPRPDSLPFYEFLKEKIDNYNLRVLVQPGITGWAQIHQKSGDSLEEAKERLAYDFYYIKNRSLILDLIIILKTIRVFLLFWGK